MLPSPNLDYSCLIGGAPTYETGRLRRHDPEGIVRPRPRPRIRGPAPDSGRPHNLIASPPVIRFLSASGRRARVAEDPQAAVSIACQDQGLLGGVGREAMDLHPPEVVAVGVDEMAEFLDPARAEADHP